MKADSNETYRYFNWAGHAVRISKAGRYQIFRDGDWHVCLSRTAVNEDGYDITEAEAKELMEKGPETDEDEDDKAGPETDEDEDDGARG